MTFRSTSWLALLVTIFVFPPTLLAQLPPSSSTTSTPIPGAGHDYIHAPVETVNPANGSVSVRIPTIMPSGRGVTLPFSFTYDSNGVNYLSSKLGVNSVWFTTSSRISQAGWSDSVPAMSAALLTWTTGSPHAITCKATIGYVFQDANGNRHNLDLTNYTDPNQTGPCTINTDRYPPGFDGLIVTTGGEGPILATIPRDGAPAAGPVTLTDGDGTVLSFSSHSVGSWTAGAATNTWLPDTVGAGAGTSLAAVGTLFIGPEAEGINITERGLQHVLETHTVGGTKTLGKSIFSAGEDVKALITAAEKVPPTRQVGGKFERIVDAGRVIGTDRTTGLPTSQYTVITRPNGNLVTAFPGKP